jgi:hypothetical protein
VLKERILNAAGMTQDRVGKAATVLSDLLKFFTYVRQKFETVWSSVPLATQLYRLGAKYTLDCHV